MTTDESKATTADTTQTPAVPARETAQGDSVAVPLSAGGPLPGMPAGEPAQGTGRPPRGRGRLAFVGLAAAVIVLGVVIYTGIRARIAADATLTQATTQAAIPTVNVVYPKADAPTQEIVLPGNTQAFISAPIYARTVAISSAGISTSARTSRKASYWQRSNRLKSISSCSRHRRISKPHRRT